mgnify:CR=1 FL=1
MKKSQNAALQPACWIRVKQQRLIIDEGEVHRCPVFQGNDIRFFPLGGDAKWKVLKHIQLLDHPTTRSMKIWNKWIWRELKLHKHAPGDGYGPESIASSSSEDSEEFGESDESEDSEEFEESDDCEVSEEFSD